MTGKPDQPQRNTYAVYVYIIQEGSVLSPSARRVMVRDIYTWSIEDGRLVFRDGNREIIAMFNQWLYFLKDDKDDE